MQRPMPLPLGTYIIKYAYGRAKDLRKKGWGAVGVGYIKTLKKGLLGLTSY